MKASTRIIVLGGGFAGAYCAQQLERRVDRSSTEIILIDKRNYFVFYPLLVEAGTGSLEPRHAVVALRHFLKYTVFRMGQVHDIDFAQRRVYFRHDDASDGMELAYDHLVIALGSVTNLPPVEGLREYGFEMKQLRDAVALRDRAIQLLERADATEDEEKRRALLHFVVVGGSFTGVELAGEFDVFLKEASRDYANVRASDCRITLLEMQDQILPALDVELGAYASEQLSRRGVRIRTGQTVSSVQRDHAMCRDGERLDTHTLIWAAGIAPASLISHLDVPTDERGYILCERDLRVKGHSSVWSIGDCAVNIDAHGDAYPATAQHAVRQAEAAAKNIAAVLRGGEVTSCDIKPRGTLAALGCRTAVARIFNIKLSGFPAWFLWRTVYLFKMPGWARRLRVALDWSMSLFFRRSVVQLGIHERKAPGEENNQTHDDGKNKGKEAA
ncbi:MAG: NAD(P)/FAD-dependent oxidoreductase [Bacteroidota bacterium]|nr:NAD(P)/FAD-dependent oxidoreductase [Bacteroidota bacterium]